MLYQDKWDRPQRDIYSLDSLIMWLEGRHPQEVYDYTSVRRCLLAQYFKEMRPGLDVTVGADTMRWYDNNTGAETRVCLPEHFNRIAHGSGFKSHTFGQALARAKKIRARNNGGPVRRVLGRLAAFFEL